MMNTQRNHAGFKNYSAESRIAPTPAGIANVPEDWAVRTISDIADVKTGPFGSSLHQRDYVDEGTPIITVEHLGERGVIHEGLPLVSESDRSRLASYRLKQGDIVFSRVGSVDRNSLISEKEDGWLFSGRLLRVRVTHENTCPAYLSYHFNSEPFKRRVRDVAVGQTMASLNTQILNSVSVVLPPLREQRAISAALSDVDELIGQLDALITKKQEIRHGTIQHLLTGSTRLPGFAGKWYMKSMSQLAQTDPESLGSDTPPDFTFNYISLEQVDAGSLIDYSALEFGSAPSRARRIVRPGDVLMSAVRPNLKGHLLFRGQVPNAVCSTGFVVLRAKDGLCDPGFLFAQMMGPVVGSQVEKALVGSNYPALNSRDVELISIPCPPTIQEQYAIAEVLSDMGAEISALFQRLDKTRAIKQGMMQELLTGCTRLI